VRQTESLVRGTKAKASVDGAKGGPPKPKSANVRDIEGRLEKRLGTRVELRDRDGAGEIVVKYSSWDELDRLLEDLLKA
jgi:ParB family chromosome partitioning protein